MLEVRPPPVPDLPPITQTTFLTCRAQYPGGPNRCVSVSSLSARPSPFNGRVGIHNFTFEACSSFTRVTACKIARPPKGGLLSRGFDPASYPTKPLGSYHVLPTTTWMDPPSTGDLRHWGAPLNNGYAQIAERRIPALSRVSLESRALRPVCHDLGDARTPREPAKLGLCC